jgi:hypothetical protein
LARNVEGRDHFEDLGIDVKWILTEIPLSVWTTFKWLRIENKGGIL